MLQDRGPCDTEVLVEALAIPVEQQLYARTDCALKHTTTHTHPAPSGHTSDQQTATSLPVFLPTQTSKDHMKNRKMVHARCYLGCFWLLFGFLGCWFNLSLVSLVGHSLQGN